MSSQQPYLGNDAGQYQPPTNNPQTARTGLQPTGDTSGVESSGGVNQQNLLGVQDLKVVVVQDSPSSTIPSDLTPAQAATQTWAGPFWGTVILATLIMIGWALRVLLKRGSPELSKRIESAIKEPTSSSTENASKKTPKKKTAVKKNTKKTQKHSAKKKQPNKRNKKKK